MVLKAIEFWKDFFTEVIQELTPHSKFMIGVVVFIVILMSVVVWIDNTPYDSDSKLIDFLAKVLKVDEKVVKKKEADVSKLMSKLFEYCNNGNIKKVKKVVEDYPHLIHATYVNGSTLLHIAISNMDRDLAVFLVENGADPNAEDDKGKSALNLCNDKELITILLEIQREVGSKED